MKLIRMAVKLWQNSHWIRKRIWKLTTRCITNRTERSWIRWCQNGNGSWGGRAHSGRNLWKSWTTAPANSWRHQRGNAWICNRTPRHSNGIDFVYLCFVLQPITKLSMKSWLSWSAPSKPLWNCCYTTPYELFYMVRVRCQSCQITSQPWCGKVKNTPTRTYDDICHYF